MLKEILDAYHQNKLIGIYTNCEDLNSFSVGYILYMDKNAYIFYELSPYGKFDGYSYRLIEDIIKIEEDSKYLNNIQKLVDYYKENINYEVFNKSKSSILKFLDYIESSNKICSIQSCNSEIFDVVGFIKKYNKNSIEIQQVDSNAVEDGIIKIKLDDIEKIVCCGDDEVKLEILYALNKR